MVLGFQPLRLLAAFIMPVHVGLVGEVSPATGGCGVLEIPPQIQDDGLWGGGLHSFRGTPQGSEKMLLGKKCYCSC